jgi:hypothetical protein
MEGQKPKPPGQQSMGHHPGAEYIEIDLTQRPDGVFVKPAGRRLRKPPFGVVAALVCGLATGMAITWFLTRSRSLSADPDSLEVVQNHASWNGRSFYLSKTSVPGGMAATSCSPGFHMASIYELLNVSTLRYEITLGLRSVDSGEGPPGLSFGWARTGSGADPLRTCDHWTSSAPSPYQGFVIRLNDLTTGSGVAPSLQPWEFLGFGEQYSSANCSTPHNVWCVQN